MKRTICSACIVELLKSEHNGEACGIVQWEKWEFIRMKGLKGLVSFVWWKVGKSWHLNWSWVEWKIEEKRSRQKKNANQWRNFDLFPMQPFLIRPFLVQPFQFKLFLFDLFQFELFLFDLFPVRTFPVRPFPVRTFLTRRLSGSTFFDSTFPCSTFFQSDNFQLNNFHFDLFPIRHFRNFPHFEAARKLLRHYVFHAWTFNRFWAKAWAWLSKARTDFFQQVNILVLLFSQKTSNKTSNGSFCFHYSRLLTVYTSAKFSLSLLLGNLRKKH